MNRSVAGQSSAGKILSLEQLTLLARREQREGKRLVLANGCFELLHAGHIRYLQAAKNAGEVLVVAINDDDSVRGLKGSGHPIVNAEHRARILAALACVDWVTIFGGSTAGSVIAALHPDLHAKGPDYSEQTVPERALVESYGGRVIIVGDPKDHSTRTLCRSISRKN